MNRITRSVYSYLLAFLIGVVNLTKEEIYLMRFSFHSKAYKKGLRG